MAVMKSFTSVCGETCLSTMVCEGEGERGREGGREGGRERGRERERERGREGERELTECTAACNA